MCLNTATTIEGQPLCAAGKQSAQGEEQVVNVQPSFDYLRTFVAVFRTGSFTAAARLVGLSQPAVTSQMQSLERQLGYSLFERRGRRISPTARARTLAAEISPHIDGLEAITGRDDELRGGQPRVLHIGGPAEYLSERVIPLLPRLAEENMEFRVSFGLADALLADLSAGIFDIVVSAIFPRMRGVESTPLIDEEFVLVASPELRERLPQDHPLTAEELKEIPVVAYGDDLAIIRRYWRTVFERPATGLRLVASIPNLRSISEAVAAGLGISVLPRYLIEGYVRTGALVALLEPEIPPLNTLHLATQKGVLHKDRWVRTVHDAFLRDARQAGGA